MKIITLGTLPEKVVYKKICQNCSCHFEFEKGEATYSPDPRDIGIMQIDCPFCHKIVMFRQ